MQKGQQLKVLNYLLKESNTVHLSNEKSVK